MPASDTTFPTFASASVSGVASAFNALIERLPVTLAVICTAGLSTTCVSVWFADNVPSCAATTRFCCVPTSPAA